MSSKLKRVTIKDLREYLIKNNIQSDTNSSYWDKALSQDPSFHGNKTFCLFCEKQNFVVNFKYTFVDETLIYHNSIQEKFRHYWLSFCSESCFNLWVLKNASEI